MANRKTSQIYTTGIDFSGLKNIPAFLLKTGKFWVFFLFFSFLTLISFSFGYKLMAVVGMFYMFCMIMRIPDTYLDAFFIESVSTCGLILLLAAGPKTAAFFTFTALWLTRYLSPYGAIEEYGETISESIATVVAIISSHFIIGMYNPSLLHLIFIFIGLRFIADAIFTFFSSPATWISDDLQNAFNYPIVSFQSYLIVKIIGLPVLNYLGASGYVLVAISAFF